MPLLFIYFVSQHINIIYVLCYISEWNIQAFSTDMYNYLIIKKDSPYEVIRKKYSIHVPGMIYSFNIIVRDVFLIGKLHILAPRGSGAGSSPPKITMEADPPETEVAELLHGRYSYFVTIISWY
jgi:hypothetical protein